MSDIDKATLLNLCDELHQVRGNISQLQATLNLVLLKAPNVDEYEELVKITNSETVTIENAELNSIYDRAKTYINSSQVKVAVRLKHLYNQGYLPLLLALAKINFKSLNNDKFVGYFLDYTPTLGGDVPDSLRDAVSPTKIKVDSSYPPTLPPISNPLLIQVLTDKSYRQPSDFIELSKYNDFSKSHNGKLYIKGKHLMELILTKIIDEKYANIDEDDMIYILSRYLDPLILTKFAFGYNLIDPFRYNLSNEISVEKKLNLFKKLFLAYVGGLDSEGYSTQEISIWIKKLYLPILTDLEPPSLYNESIKQLQFFLKSFERIEEMAISFDQIDMDPFVAQLSINGEIMSVGTDSTSYDVAKSKAAYNLLNNETYKEKLLSILYKQYSPSYE
jgi:dsRNA-specific ribonuclease